MRISIKRDPSGGSDFHSLSGVMTNLRGVHCSGRFDSDPAEFVKYVLRCIEEKGGPERVHVVSTTEVQDRRKRKGLVKALKELGYRVRTRGEHVVGLNKNRFGRITFTRLKWLTSEPGFPNWRQMKVMFLKAKDLEAGRPAVISLTHSPAGIESGNSFRMKDKYSGKKNVAVPVAKSGFTKWGNLGRKWIRRNPKRYVLFLGDMNLNAKAEHWNEWLSERLNAECALAPGTQTPGTLGFRFIDLAFISGKGTQRGGAHAIVDVKRPVGVDHVGSFWSFQVRGSE